MEWLVVIAIFVTVSRCSDGKELSSISTKEIEDQGVRCNAGSEWLKDCFKCTCPDSGIAQCVRIAKCDTKVAGPGRCKASTAYQQDCNRCFCMEGQIACTAMKCTSQSRNIDIAKAHMQTEKRCAPGTKWKSQCRDCECSEFGAPICDLKDCLGQNTEPLLECAPGSQWKNDCNDCWCTDGIAFCTRMGCAPVGELNLDNDDLKLSNKKAENMNQLSDIDGNSIHSLIRRSVCKPNQNFQNDCNACKCAADGLSYKCTQNECMDKEDSVNKEVEVFMENEGVDHIERHSVCQPRGTFYIGCNTCHCNNFGTDYSCTNKPCPLPEDVELFHELKAKSSQSKGNITICVANKMFIKDCNTCWCNEDGTTYSCTRRVCLHDLDEEDTKLKDLRVILRQCRPDEVFELDCNMCRCNADGKSYSCTRRACAQEPPVEPALGSEELPTHSRKARAPMDSTGVYKTCDPGKEFRMDCNMCLCDHEGQDFSCTRNDCRTGDLSNPGTAAAARTRREVARQAVNKCEPGSVFQQDCNVCRCTSDGHHATCTLKRCSLKPDGGKSKQDDPKSESDPNFRCNPGEQFKRGCDDCTCSADGKSVFCTLLLCDKEVYES